MCIRDRSYGAAGAVVLVLLWVYYGSCIIFFGAEFTQVYAREIGSDPLQQRRRRDHAQETTQPVAQHVPAEYPESAAGQTSGAVATVGSVLGGALALSRIVSLFRNRK